MRFISMVLLGSSLALGCSSSSSDDRADWPNNVGCRELYGFESKGWSGPGDCTDGLDRWTLGAVTIQVETGPTTKSAEVLASESYALLPDPTHVLFEPRPLGKRGGYWFGWRDTKRIVFLYFLVERGVAVKASFEPGISEAEASKILSSMRVL